MKLNDRIEATKRVLAEHESQSTTAGSSAWDE